MTERPSLDVIIPAANAADTIGETVDAVRSQTYPNLRSIVVAAFDDETAKSATDRGATVVRNPSGKTPAGLNLALRRSDAEIVARVDTHSLIPPGYLERAVDTILATEADCVGGMQVPVGGTWWQRAIAASMASPFGAGDARYRIGGRAGPVETVYLGVFRRSAIDRVGGYDEHFERNQDYEMNHRIASSGGLVWFDPELKVEYRPRGSLRELARQYFDYGRWKREFSRIYAAGLRWRQLAPPLLVAILAASTVAGFWWAPFWLIPGGYLLVLLLIGVASVSKTGSPGLGVPLALATMHLSWGLGFLSGRPNRSRRT